MGYPVIATLGRTLRWKVEGLENIDVIRASGREPVWAFWHGRILHVMYFFRGGDVVVMISENFDGEWIGRLSEKFGYCTVRGSSSRGGARALSRMRKHAVDGRATAFAVDGPRGPAQSVQLGAIWLASLSGNPLLPVHSEADSHWTARSWDGAQVPKPFANVSIVVGRPIEVQQGVDSDVIEEKRLELERSLCGLGRRASKLLKGK